MKEFNESDCQFIQVNELNLRYYDKGEGKPLLLLHGFPDDLTVWKYMIPFFQEAGFRVIAFDQRGFGESGLLTKQSDYRIDKIVSDIPALLSALAINEPIYLVGHDWGSVIAWAFCLAHPKKVHASVNISVGHPESYRRSGISQKFIKGFYTLWFQIRGLAEGYLKQGGFKRWLGRHPEPEITIKKMMRQGRLSAGLSWYRANFSTILFNAWPKCKVPSLSIWSEYDDYLTEKHVLCSEKYMSAKWEYFKVNKAGHWIPLEKPKELTERIIKWFECS